MDVLRQIKQCTHCVQHLPFAPRPIIQYSAKANIIIIGQAPGLKAHDSYKPWNDPSGVRLRQWLLLNEQSFYNPELVSILPMGFCYPGRGKSGDLPPRPECAPKWHPQLLENSSAKLMILIGKYAQDYYLNDKRTLTDRLANWQEYLPHYLVLPHPSPRNNIWLKKHPWFEEQVLPEMKVVLNQHLKITLNQHLK